MSKGRGGVMVNQHRVSVFCVRVIRVCVTRVTNSSSGVTSPVTRHPSPTHLLSARPTARARRGNGRRSERSPTEGGEYHWHQWCYCYCYCYWWWWSWYFLVLALALVLWRDCCHCRGIVAGCCRPPTRRLPH